MKLFTLVFIPLLITSTIISPPSAIAQSCSTDVARCDRIVTASNEKLEPSGLVWAANLNLAIAVHDERLEQPGYEIFAFDPSSAALGKVKATPLLTRAQSDKFQLDDLEGLTQTEDGTFYAFTSLSLDKDDNSPEDRWSRFQAVHFQLVKTDSNLTVTNIERLSGSRRPNLREWFISSSDRKWVNESYRKRAEKGGINVEGLASTSSGNLIVGFRGPLVTGPKALLAELTPPKTDQAPSAPKWHEIDVSGLPGWSSMKDRGIRAIERVPGDDSNYVIVLGHAGGNYDNLRVGILSTITGLYSDRFELPDQFVAEGVAVTKVTDTKLTLLLVSDLKGYFMKLEINR